MNTLCELCGKRGGWGRSVLMVMVMALIFAITSSCEEQIENAKPQAQKPQIHEPDLAEDLPLEDPREGNGEEVVNDPVLLEEETSLLLPDIAASTNSPRAIKSAQKRPVLLSNKKYAQEVILLSPGQQKIFDRLQRKNLKLMIENHRLQEKNMQMIRSLLEARELADQLQTDINRNRILMEIAKGEIAELHNQLSRLNADQDSSPMRVQTNGQFRKKAEKMHMLKELNRKLSVMVTKQADELNALRASRLAMKNIYAEKQRSYQKHLLAKTALLASQEMMIYELQQKLAVAQGRAKTADTKADAKLPETGDETSPVTLRQPGRSLSGEITKLTDAAITVNLGREDGLKKGTRLIVYRGDNFIGYLRVDDISKNQAACAFTRIMMSAQVGDSVTDRLD